MAQYILKNVALEKMASAVKLHMEVHHSEGGAEEIHEVVSLHPNDIKIILLILIKILIILIMWIHLIIILMKLCQN